MNVVDILDCEEGGVGTWFDGCSVEPGDFIKMFLLNPSVLIEDPVADFDESARAELIQKDLLVPLNDAEQIADVPAANNYQTMPNKRMLFISQGLYMFSAMFRANVCFVKALHKLKRKRWTLLLLDSNGKLWFDNGGNGTMTGFQTVPDFSVENETVNDGGSKVAMVEIKIQLTQRGTQGYNERRSFQLGDDFDSIKGVQDTVINADTLSIASLKVTVKSGCDGNEPILGLGSTDILVYNASTGAIIATTVTENGNGQYTIAGATAGARIIKLGDDTLNVDVANVLDKAFYRSNKLAVTLTT